MYQTKYCVLPSHFLLDHESVVNFKNENLMCCATLATSCMTTYRTFWEWDVLSDRISLSNERSFLAVTHAALGCVRLYFLA
jgi:hypothetical protein